MLLQESTATVDGDHIDAAVFGGEYSAQLSADGKLLTWSDGDVWSFLAPHRVAAGRRKAGAASEDALPHSKKTKQTKRKTDGHIRRTDTGGSGAAQRTPDEPQEPQSRGGSAAGTAAANGGGRVAEQMESDCPLEEELQQEHKEEQEEQGGRRN